MFNELGLSPKVLSAVEAAGYTKPTPIQAAAIPHALMKRDVLGLAQTGTGKTASFVLPMLSLLEKGRARARMPRTLILEPTRELAAQVEESFVKYGVNHKLTVALLIGGVSFNDQDRKVDRGADVVIATPGRLLDHVERGKLILSQIEILVVDEADRMLDMGFIPDIERICKLLPVKRQTLFFSATMPKEIVSLVDRFLNDPVRVEVSPPSTAAETVEQRFVASQELPKDKRNTLRRLLQSETELTNGIVFVNRKRDIGTLFRSLERHGFSVGSLHGDMDQRSRMATLDAFKTNKLTLLVASDVAARGLDIPKVSHIFNYDVPIHADDYIHRIGRTGRAGRSGKAFTIATREERKFVAAIEAMLKHQVEWLDGTPATGANASRTDRDDEAADDRGAARGRGRDRREPRPERDPDAVRAPRRVSAHAGERTERQPERAAAGPPHGEPRDERRPETPRDERRPDAARAERNPQAARAERNPEAARAEHNPEAARAERNPEAARAERRPEAARAERRHDSPREARRSETGREDRQAPATGRDETLTAGEPRPGRYQNRDADEPRVAFADTPYVPDFLRRPISRRALPRDADETEGLEAVAAG